MEDKPELHKTTDIRSLNLKELTVFMEQSAIGKLKWDPDHPDRPEDKNIGNCNDWWDAENYTILDFIEYVDLDRR